MADFSLLGGSSIAENVSYDSANTRGTQVESAGTTNTKGAWQEMTSSASYSSSRIVVMSDYQITNTAGAEVSIDIGVGGSGSEEVIIPDLYYQQGGQLATQGAVWDIPVTINSGDRVAARIASNVATRRCALSVFLFDGSYKTAVGGSGVVTYGFNSGSTSGLAVDAGAVADTKGGWAEISASTNEDINGFFFVAGI